MTAAAQETQVVIGVAAEFAGDDVVYMCLIERHGVFSLLSQLD
jgi:hypothetical protein